MKRSLIRAAAVVLLSSLLGACGGNTVIDQQGTPCTSTPSSTELMQTTWADAQAYEYSCNWHEDDLLDSCLDDAAGDDQKTQACFSTSNIGHNRCQYYWAQRINKIPIRECGVKIFDLAATFDPESYQITLVEGDFDGDGISNWEEIMMGMNPCEEFSFGTCNLSDADDDYDADGMPNGTDSDGARCNPNDPAGSQTDCV